MAIASFAGFPSLTCAISAQKSSSGKIYSGRAPARVKKIVGSELFSRVFAHGEVK
jgi:hypothetical protein